jgi:acyl carrier protein
MKERDFLLLLDELLELGPGTLRGDEALESLEGWNSLAVISLMALVDDHFDMSLQARQIAGCSTIADLIGLLGDRISKQVGTYVANV